MDQHLLFFLDGQSIGVCYGRLGGNLPYPSVVVSLYKSKNINAMRFYDPYNVPLQALKGSNITFIVIVPNDNLQCFVSDASAANTWVQNNIKAYWPAVKFKYIAVGNEVIPGNLAQYVLQAMQNIHKALTSAGLPNQIKVSTAISTTVLGTSYPPSSSSFSSVASPTLGSIIKFLSSNGSPLLANVYPYFSYVGNTRSIDLRYALFTSPGTVVIDGSLQYQNLFDAIVDSLYSALEKVGGSNVGIVISDSGWSSAGGTAATIDNTWIYNQNLINHVRKGTPKNPKAIDVYI
ncbi:glucan endo-1,3-beta-glucosidase-like [Dioscorea cayenensis subsp. rotundata]|uniref:Glucan endo-1,3-beta-glucosidase-like n=1 Tax=Dioscorea cayennensis subsp. rotundata TaxID=55577 RepID=A0AB40B0T7_DIOCR|nr:glucan endo-1,3-beta-glucosidase-like [Dioscorea cayenensis subsp. rotundata]